MLHFNTSENKQTFKLVAVLKMAAISQRITIRDYYDLYFISKYHIQLEDIFKLTKKLLPNLSQIVYTETIIFIEDIKEEDVGILLNPKEKINKYEISNYFINELKRLKNDKNSFNSNN